MSEPPVLRVGDTGPYAILTTKQNPQGLSLVYVSGLLALHGRAEQLKGRPLSEPGLKRIADEAEAIAVPWEVAEKTIADRGYK
jgi:hypothetical protein